MERRGTPPWRSGLGAGLSMSFSLLAMALLEMHLPEAPWRSLVRSLGYPVGFEAAFEEAGLVEISQVHGQATPARRCDRARIEVEAFSLPAQARHSCYQYPASGTHIQQPSGATGLE